MSEGRGVVCYEKTWGNGMVFAGERACGGTTL